jgi:quinoprotein glucose dehydrogenase
MPMQWAADERSYRLVSATTLRWFENALVVSVLLVPSTFAAESTTLAISTADGVFTIEQADSGKRAFTQHCSSGCHGSDLTGLEGVPALAGEAFVARWEGLSVGALFQRIRRTMPQSRPQSLSDNTYIDIIAFLLDANGYPSGQRHLIPTQALLDAITVGEP